jgi:putative addiction module killer protein
VEIRRLPEFRDWFAALPDRKAANKIAVRLARLEMGLFGDVRPVGSGVSELRIDYGPGFRLYYIQRGPVVIVLLCGGDKKTQDRDIRQALKLAATLED